MRYLIQLLHGIVLKERLRATRRLKNQCQLFLTQLLYKLFRPYDLMRSKMENRALILAVF